MFENIQYTYKEILLCGLNKAMGRGVVQNEVKS